MKKGIQYKLILTTVNKPSGENGINYPLATGLYKILTQFQPTSLNAHNKYEFLQYIEVYPAEFTSLSLKGLIQESNAKNLIYVTLIPSVNIESNDLLCFEFPTKTIDGILLFEEQLGISGMDGTFIDVDVISLETS